MPYKQYDQMKNTGNIVTRHKQLKRNYHGKEDYAPPDFFPLGTLASQ